jgi:cell wall-associated NlpC family hydrolase
MIKRMIFYSVAVLGLLLWCTSCESSKPALESYRKVPSESSSNSLQKTRTDIIKLSRNLIGCKYKTAGKDKKGFDCSGFVIYVFKEFNIAMAASSDEQAKRGDKISIDEAREGDLVFFGSSKKISHVGIITVNKKRNLGLIHSTSSKGVIEENILESDYWLKRIQKIVSLESYVKSNEISYQF